MNWSPRFRLWFRALAKKRELDDDIDAELQSHIEMQIAENIQEGMSPTEARRAALRHFGGLESIKETCREQRHVRWLEEIVRNLRYSVRTLRKNPGFTTVAVLTLALGIGATTIVFSIVNGVLLKPLDYPGSERIVNVWEGDAKKRFQGGYNNYTSPANFVDWRRENQVFEAIAFAAHHHGWITLSFIHIRDDGAEKLLGRFVSVDYFKVFGVEPILGRSFLPEEEARGARRVVVISHALWQRVYNGDPNVLGKSITLENQGRHSYEIIGVMPPKFRFPGADVWVSCAHMPRPMTLRASDGMHVIARLKPNISIERAQMEMNVIQSRIYAEYGHLRQGDQAMGSQIRLQPLLDWTVSGVRPSLILFLGAVALVLLIACANVANLQLSRALSRQREIAMRIALGATRRRIIGQLLWESAVLAILGAIFGTLLAFWGTKVVVQYSAGTIPRIETVGIDFRVFLFAIVVSLTTGILFGLVPAWQASRVNLAEWLKDGTQRVSSGLAQMRLRSVFTISQIALALVLVIGAGLLIRSFNRLQNVKTGFDTDELLVVEIAMLGSSYENVGQRCIFLRRLIEEIGAVSGVEVAAAVSSPPSRSAWSHPFARSDRPVLPAENRSRAGVRVATPGFFKTYGIPLLRGRDLSESDTPQSQKVVLINQALADEIFPGEDPLGKRIDLERESWVIIGLFGNVKNTGLAGETQPEVLVGYQQWGFLSMHLTVRAVSNPLGLAPIVTERVRALNPAQPLNYFHTMRSMVDATTAQPRFRSLLLGSFALIALVLASVGIYGVMAYSVAQRTNEIGIRMALGAQKSHVVMLVLKQGLTLTLIGVIIGLSGSIAFARLLKAYLFGISTIDLATFVAVSVLLILVAVAACMIPALRAMRVSPMEALRYD